MPTVDTASRPASPQVVLLARYPLTFYFLITFTCSWLMFLPAVLTYYEVLQLSPSIVGLLGIAGLLGPILSGFIMTAVTEGRWVYAACYIESCYGGSGFDGTCSLL